MIAISKILKGKRVLIVEDELLVALMLEVFLTEFGCIPVGPCSTVAKALETLRTEVIDLAVLDVNLDGEMVYPVAYALTERHLPFLFVSGYGEQAILPGHDDWSVCSKPFKGHELEAMLEAMLDDDSFQRGEFPHH